jgi:hypothetical protein
LYGLSFNKKTGTISGVPIAASDPVTYTVTAALMAMMEVDRRGQKIMEAARNLISLFFIFIK